jgi:type I restriction-modification system DNA methylase subunit
MSKRATENTLSKINKLLEIEESYKAPERIMDLISNEETAKKLFLNALVEFDYDLSYEWFTSYFEDEHADRKNKKQDFTPTCLSRLMSEMISSDKSQGIIYEPAAGSGSTIISHWQSETGKFRFPWDYNPADYLYVCSELSDKVVPFLLFNLLIRGINAAVIHGNTLTKECKEVYACINESNDYMSFSRLVKLPHNKDVEEIFDVNFKEAE